MLGFSALGDPPYESEEFDWDLFLFEAVCFVFYLIGGYSLLLTFAFVVGDIFRLVERDLLLLTELLVFYLLLIGLFVLRLLLGDLGLCLWIGDLLGLDLGLDLPMDRILNL